VLDFQALGDADMRAGKSVPDESAELIAHKGNEHEWAYLQRLRAGLESLGAVSPIGVSVQVVAGGAEDET